MSYIDGSIYVKQTAQNSASLDYLSMMTGIELPIEEDEDEVPADMEEDEA